MKYYRFLLPAFLLLSILGRAQTKLTSFSPGAIWPDDKGVHINAHGGGILYNNGVYYWFGEHKIAGDAGNRAMVGVHCYSSKDLYNWKDEGISLSVSPDTTNDIAKGCILERPKVVYNKKTKKYVMWFHLELLGKGYSAARAGVAVSDKVIGPYKFIKSYRPNPGQMPFYPALTPEGDKINCINPAHETDKFFCRDLPGGQMARDMTVFVDDDGKLYMYNGSSNRYPIYGIEINRTTFRPIGARKEMYFLEPWRYGWQRFGEYYDNTFLDPFIEGSWMTKHNGKYYLQYGAPGTEFSGYADGVVVGDHPLGPFTPQSMPFSYKPAGFTRGAGHGATFKDKEGNWWHVSTIAISVKNNFERRLGLWPAGFDKDDVLYMDAAFGDYPHYLPNDSSSAGKSQGKAGSFTGWMLLNYSKPITVSSTLGAYYANYAVDENIKTYWSAATGNKGEWIQSDLGKICTVRAIQINYADQDVDFLGKQQGIYHQYKIWHSTDGKKWKLLIDKSKNKTDVPFLDRQVVHPLPANENIARRRHLQSRNHPKHRRLAAAARSQQRHQLAFVHGKADVVDGGNFAELLGHTFQFNTHSTFRR